jgi:hypothetical protein
MSVLKYLKTELDFRAVEWQNLSEDDKNWYRQAAREEMEVLGIEVK